MADYHSLLMRAVANLPNAGTPATRAAIYGRARKALLEQLRSLRPPLPESDIAREETALDAAIAEIERTYGSQEPAPTTASTPPAAAPPPAAGKPARACERRSPPPPPPQFSTVQRPSAPSAPGAARAPRRDRLSNRVRQRQSAPAATPVQAVGAAASPPTQGPEPAAAAPQAPTLSAGGQPPLRRRWTSPARSQLAAAMANQPSSASRPAGPLLRSGARARRG